MTCLVCQGATYQSTEQFHTDTCCVVEQALENIKNHYEFFKNGFFGKERQINELQQRNERLMKAVKLLKSRETRQPSSTTNINDKSCNNCKRRRTNSVESDSLPNSISLIDSDDNVDVDFNFSERQAPSSVLDTAITSENLFETTTTSPMIPLSPRSESIIETEKQRSPKGKWTMSRRRGLLKLKTLDANRPNIVENKKPLFGMNNLSDRDNPTTIINDVHDENKFKEPLPTGSKAVKSEENSKNNERRSLLTLSKKYLKQTRLKFDETRKESDEDKPKRSLLLSSVKTIQSKNKSVEDDDIFDFSKPAISFDTNSDSSEPNDCDAKENDLFATKDNILDPMENQSKSDDSVIALTPTTQDIIFLDDTTDEQDDDADITRIEPMDLLKNIMENTSHNTSNSKRKSVAVTDPVETKDKMGIKRKMVLQKHSAAVTEEPPLNALLKESSDSFCNTAAASVKVKQERVSQDLENISANHGKLDINEKPDNGEDEDGYDDEIFVRPIIVKKEEKKKINVKETYNIDCDDCQHYIDFLGDRVTNSAIVEQLNGCRVHNQNQNLVQETPPGFWNPFILSYDENDPRNEVLVDDRFVGKKRVQSTTKNNCANGKGSTSKNH